MIYNKNTYSFIKMFYFNLVRKKVTAISIEWDYIYCWNKLLQSVQRIRPIISPETVSAMKYPKINVRYNFNVSSLAFHSNIVWYLITFRERNRLNQGSTVESVGSLRPVRIERFVDPLTVQSNKWKYKYK